jgi:hypothetical protein
MDLLSGNIGGINFAEMKRGHFYMFSYANMQSNMNEPMVVNPIIVFSALDRNRRIQGLDLRILRNHDIFLDDYEKFYMKDGKIKVMYKPEHPHAFSFRILKALFLRNPDVEQAWRVYNPLHMKGIKDINIQETRQEMRNFHKVRLNNMGVL